MSFKGSREESRWGRPARSQGRSQLAPIAALVLAMGLLAGLGGCGGKQVTRIDTNSVTDLSGRWNDTDSRLVSEEMVGDILNAPWIQRYATKNQSKRPTVIVGTVRNRSTEHIPVETFTKDIERAFVNSGEVRLVASSLERGEVRDERRDQQDFSSPETVKKFGQELGADYMLMGSINTITDQEGGDKVVFYQVSMELTDIQTNEKVWLNEKEIKKYIGRGKFKG